MMTTGLNGWLFDRDTKGYYAIGGNERFGPYPTPQELRHFAKRNRCPYTLNEHKRRDERKRSPFLLAVD